MNRDLLQWEGLALISWGGGGADSALHPVIFQLLFLNRSAYGPEKWLVSLLLGNFGVNFSTVNNMSV